MSLRDFAAVVALAVLCLFFDDEGVFEGGKEAEAVKGKGKEKREIEKMFVKSRLAWIMGAMPGARPSRATLNSVNAFLMGRGE